MTAQRRETPEQELTEVRKFLTFIATGTMVDQEDADEAIRLAKVVEAMRLAAAAYDRNGNEIPPQDGIFQPRVEYASASVIAELETLRMQLAACTAAALGNTDATVAERLPRGHPYSSATYSDVCGAVDREMAHRTALASVIAEMHPHLENMADALREKAAMEQSQRAIESFIAEWRERASHIYDFSAKAIAERKEETLDFSACVGITLVLDDLSGLLSRLQGATR